MPDYVLLDGDLALFQPTFGMATVVVRPGTLRATGQSGCKGKKLCVDGDEKSVEVPGCMYITTLHTIPGAGTLKIQALAPNQKAPENPQRRQIRAVERRPVPGSV